MHPLQLQALIDCIGRIRPASVSDYALAKKNIEEEIEMLSSDTHRALSMGESFQKILSQPRQYSFYTDMGMRSSLGFVLEVARRLQDKVLPLKRNPNNWQDLVKIVFHKKNDYLWVESIEDELWLSLLKLFNLSEIDTELLNREQLHALRLLSYRLVNVALDQEIVRFNTDIIQTSSPFLTQNELLLPLLDALPTPEKVTFTIENIKQIRDVLAKCALILQQSHERARTHGISVRATYLLSMAGQIIERMQLLLVMPLSANKQIHTVRLFKVLLHDEQEGTPISHFIGTNVELLSRNITDHASRHGEHYIAEDRAQWIEILRSAALGGIVISFMAIFKLLISVLHLPPLTEGLLFCLNYGLGFVIIHLVGGVVATKQPAMTAANIANHIKDVKSQDIGQLVALIRSLVGSQVIAVIGNVIVALPLTALIVWGLKFIEGFYLAPPAKMQSLLTANNPLNSAVIWYAAIAGVGLFLSGLVSGFFDNRARYSRFSERVSIASFLKWLGTRNQQWLGKFVDKHYGAIMGNLFFGFYLGLASAVGVMTGLPLDIRHIAFSSANVGLAAVDLGWSESQPFLIWSVIGVLIIGIVNLLVSFSLALWVALQSKRLGFRPFFQLAKLVIKDFAKNPLNYFIPPKNKV